MIVEKRSDSELGWLEAEKFPIWQSCGADKKTLIETASGTDGPVFDPDAEGGWTRAFIRLGDLFLDRAHSPAKGDAERADLYDLAALYYGIARYPAAETPMKKEAYTNQISALANARDYYHFSMRREKISLGDAEITANYYTPRLEKEIIVPEAVMLTGGAETTKEDLHFIARQIVNDGMACLVIDMPGTGESQWKLRPPGINAVYSRAIKYLAGRGSNDPNRIGMIGMGFGGYWSVASAAACPELKAAVNCGGPVHRAFAKDSLIRQPGCVKVALSKAMGFDPSEFDKATVELERFSLLKRVDLRKISCPLLSINGSNDPCVPIEDLFILAEEGGIKQEEWIFREDGHCAPWHFKEWMPRSVAWVANMIGGRERMPRPDLALL